jgi:hypothetical protein
MNVYEMEGFLRGKCMPRDILVNESNAAYLVRKLNEATAVKAERDSLAVENAELKADRATLAEYWIADGGDEECAKSYCEDTPATDVALAAIEARGVEKFGDHMLTLANDPTYSTASHRNDLRDAGAKAKDYATELREAK